MNETRAKAGAILSGHKLRMLEDAGITVVAKEQLADFERLYEAVRNWRYGLIDKYDKRSGLAATYPAIYRLATTFDEVERLKNWRSEAMEK